MRRSEWFLLGLVMGLSIGIFLGVWTDHSTEVIVNKKLNSSHVGTFIYSEYFDDWSEVLAVGKKKVFVSDKYGSENSLKNYKRYGWRIRCQTSK